MAVLRRLPGLPFACVVALFACACQRDSSTHFDDSQLGVSGSTSSNGGSEMLAGESSAGSDAGSEAGASGAFGGKSSAGAATGGMVAGGNLTGGQAGTAAGGSPATAGSASAGKVGMAEGGAGGSEEPAPEPVVYETRAVDDAGIAECLKNIPMGGVVSVTVDSGSSGGLGNAGCAYRALFSVPLPNIPASAEVQEATFTLTCSNAGDTIDVSFVDSEWEELSVTWNSRPEMGEGIDRVICQMPGKVTIDLKAAVAAWLTAEHDNFGLYLSTEGTDGTDFVTSEGRTEDRPRLRVVYVPR